MNKKQRIARIANKIAKKIVAETILTKFKKMQQKLQELKKSKDYYDKLLKWSNDFLKQFEADLSSGKITFSGKGVNQKKDRILRWCKKPPKNLSTTPKALGAEISDEDDKNFQKAIYNVYNFSEKPNNLKWEVFDCEEQVKRMSRELDSALRLKDNLPPEFEKALQNVYKVILADCEARKQQEINKWTQLANNVWDVMTNQNNPYYKEWVRFFGGDGFWLERFDFRLKDCKNVDDFKRRVNERVKKYVDGLNKVKGNTSEVIKYVESNPQLYNMLKHMCDYKKPENFDKCIQYVKDQIKPIHEAAENRFKSYSNHFNFKLDAAKRHSAEKEATFFYNEMRDRFIVDLSRYCSEIVKVESATIGLKGNIDAIVTAPNGVFKVRAVPAGGYNIQRYHYRVLINRMR